jgi:hypothetical protein
MPENVIYNLKPIMGDPKFEGFGFGDAPSLRGKGRLAFDFDPDNIQTRRREWTITRMAPTWSPQPVFGQVHLDNDYPCVNLTVPAFSRRAVDALRDLLEPNGELLPLASSGGEYYAYNITTVVDILDHQLSDIVWFDEKHDVAIRVRRYECIPEKLTGLSIFRLVELPSSTFVHQVFIDRVGEHKLRGFVFKRLYPLPNRKGELSHLR